jgi:hypothetical protein
MCVATAAPQAAFPQTSPSSPRPSSGLYQGDARNDEGRQSLFFTGTISEAYDDNIIGSDALNSIAARAKASGFYSRAEGRLSYVRRNATKRVRFVSDGTARLDYYPRLSGQLDQPIDSYEGHAGVDVPIGRGSLRLNQSIGYQPYFVLDTLSFGVGDALTPADGLTTAVAADVTLFSEPLTTYSSSAALTTPLSRRISLDGSYTYRGAASARQWSDITDQGGAVRLNLTTSRRSNINFGYTHRVATFEPPTRPRSEMTVREFQMGYAYRRSLSSTRSIGLDVGTGAARLDIDTPSTESRDSQQVLGYAAVSYQFGRTWSGQGEFRRALQVLRGLSESFFGESASGSIHGLLSRRVDLTIAGTYSDGDAGIAAFSTTGYNTRTGIVRIRYALNRSAAVSSEYMYAQYRIGNTVELPAGVVRELARNVIRVGLTFGMPIISHP